MSQNPLSSLQRRPVRIQETFPNARYRETVLEPISVEVDAGMSAAARSIWMAHGLDLLQSRVMSASQAADAFLGLLDEPAYVQTADDLIHPLRRVETLALSRADGVLRLGTAVEEIIATAARMVTRDAALDVQLQLTEVRSALIRLSNQHLNTLIVLVANGQSVQPTSLAHYLLALATRLRRDGERLTLAYDCVNSSPMGGVAGVSSAITLDRRLVAELLGFDGVLENALDAVSGTDWMLECAAVAQRIALTIDGFLADLRIWSRDDIGTIVPSPGFTHVGTRQPHRADPAVLDHLHLRVAELSALPTRIGALLIGLPLLGSDTIRLTALGTLRGGFELARETLMLVRDLVLSLDVNRAMVANRTNRGFSTSSELAELFAIDLKLPVHQAFALAEQVVSEALQRGLDATTLRTDLIDQIALREIGRELGIEPELLSRCLAPKRFVERRDGAGGPAPHAVAPALQQEHLAVEQALDWVAERRQRLSAAQETLLADVNAYVSQSRAEHGE